eukprot:TRINITY_DN105267_c0_g1_i1.p1 TRINITY_DN105267_c0_g1~~TRINITY_DN105267_c0_g1_i1.p1  ORF type:complete len:444 (+),score=98.31 TRINITY_DN105267_c0_g1_i1:126-1334(+)
MERTPEKGAIEVRPLLQGQQLRGPSHYSQDPEGHSAEVRQLLRSGLDAASRQLQQVGASEVLQSQLCTAKAMDDDAAGTSTTLASLGLHCNFPQGDAEPQPCALPVDGSIAWATGCCHVFCPCHAESWFGGAALSGRAQPRSCPVCGCATELWRLDLARSTRERRLAVMGLSPKDVLVAAGEALEFWLAQKVLEVSWEKSAAASGKKLELRAFHGEKEQADLSQRQQLLRRQLEVASARKTTLEKEKARLQNLLQKMPTAAAPSPQHAQKPQAFVSSKALRNSTFGTSSAHDLSRPHGIPASSPMSNRQPPQEVQATPDALGVAPKWTGQSQSKALPVPSSAFESGTLPPQLLTPTKTDEGKPRRLQLAGQRRLTSSGVSFGLPGIRSASMAGTTVKRRRLL